jgi:hypothetical protein
MATLAGNLWEWNLTKVVIVDVTDDYRYMLSPMPGEFYPVITELYLPRLNLDTALQTGDLVDGYLYDWHESPADAGGSWYVGVVDSKLTSDEDFLRAIRKTIA